MTADPTKFQLYGRRKGKPLRRHHFELMEQLLPRLRIDVASPQVAGETWLEIGFGGGEHLAHQAALHPQVQFIGAEPFINGVAKLLAEVEERQLHNVRVHSDDARYLLPALPTGSITRVYLLYPDPWPKARQNKRRFVNPDNLKQIARLLPKGGLFLFASDIADYVQWTLDEVAQSGQFELSDNSPEPYANWVQTRYEAKARREGRSSRYLTFTRI